VRSSYPHVKVNGIVNLSDHKLTKWEINVLTLGPSFISQPSKLNCNKAKNQLQRVVFNKPAIEEILNDLSRAPNPLNLKGSEIKTILQLRNNPNIVITKADKGDSWVILNRADYLAECHRQLGDISVYCPLESPGTLQNLKGFRNILISMLKKRLITGSKFRKLIAEVDKLKARIFYILPKIHKPPASWPGIGKIPPGRPIIGNSFSEDTEICRFIDTFLKPIVLRQPYILVNSDQLICEVAKVSISNNAILFTLDVNSLYTNIPIDKGLETVKQFFESFPDPSRPDKHIISLLSLSLYKNDFLFNGQYFQQKKGVAMGKQYAPNFANLYMSKWENHLLKELPGKKPILWFRYIDDIFGIWEGPIKELMDFIVYVNSVDANIQVSGNSSFTDIQFLDLVIFKNNEFKLGSMVFLKPTSSLKLIHPRSLHPQHLKLGVITSQIVRFIKNCTYGKDFRYQLGFLFEALGEQGYTRASLRKAKQKAYEITNFTVEEGVILKGFFPCKTNCSLCERYGTNTTHITYPGGAKVISQYLTCSSKNAIYVIDCKKCQLKYVGETSRKVKERICQHVSNIKLKYATPVSEHFNSLDHNLTDFTFFIIGNNTGWSDLKRKTVENNWIKKLGTLKPLGMNSDLNKIPTNFITVPFKGNKSLPGSFQNILGGHVKPSFTTGLPLRVTFHHKHQIARGNPEIEN